MRSSLPLILILVVLIHSTSFGQLIPSNKRSQETNHVVETINSSCRGQWSTAFPNSGASGIVYKLFNINTDEGPALVASGAFNYIDGTVTNGVGILRNSRWENFGSPKTGRYNSISSIASVNHGGILEVYATGSFYDERRKWVFAGLAKREGSSWVIIDTGLSIIPTHLAIDDRGEDIVIYVAGRNIGDFVDSHVVKWDGTSWSEIAVIPYRAIKSMILFDDGNGLALYIGKNKGYVQKWINQEWENVGESLNGAVNSFALFDDGNGPSLYAAGGFSRAGNDSVGHVAKLDGTSWVNIDSNIYGTVDEIKTLADGEGEFLYAVGDFRSAGNFEANNIIKWNGVDWLPQGEGVGVRLFSVEAYDNGSGNRIYVGGFSNKYNNAVNNFAVWNGSSWTDTGIIEDVSTDFPVNALASFDDGSGNAVYAGGIFRNAGKIKTNGIAKWNGNSWEALGGGMNKDYTSASVETMCVYDDGNGPALFAGGHFGQAGEVEAYSIARWDGKQWFAVGRGVFGTVKALIVFDDGSGPALYVGGTFTNWIEGNRAIGILRWDGQSWSAVGSGLEKANINAFAIYHDLQGPVLYAAGYLKFGGPRYPEATIARWNGQNWRIRQSENTIDGAIYSLTTYDDGQGESLYAGGMFHIETSNEDIYNIAKWDGAQWSGVGDIESYQVTTLATLNAPEKSLLIAAFHFELLSWNGKEWSNLRQGVIGQISALQPFYNGSDISLFAGGSFHLAGDKASSYLAEWKYKCSSFDSK